MKIIEFLVLNWNVAGARYLELPKKRRSKFRKELNDALRSLIKRYSPHVVTLQEIVRYGSSASDAEDIINEPPGYKYYSFPLIDTERLSARRKWDEVKKRGRWAPDTYFAQGNAFLFRKDLRHFPIYALPTLDARLPERKGHFVEQVSLESGLYFGDRNTEPRAALVAHFVFDVQKKDDRPLDIFVVNTHLTTLRMEREGIPEIDMQALSIRRDQLKVIFHGIISRYNTWRQEQYRERGRPRPKRDNETIKRHHPIWILAGDFNFTEESEEHRIMEQLNFIDLNPDKGLGTKSSGFGNPPTLTVDYIFAGPQFIALDPLITPLAIRGNRPADTAIKVSDHYPLFATIPLRIQD